MNAKAKNGEALINRKELTRFSNIEEEGVKRTKVVPFLLNGELKKMEFLILEEKIGLRMPNKMGS